MFMTDGAVLPIRRKGEHDQEWEESVETHRRKHAGNIQKNRCWGWWWGWGISIFFPSSLIAIIFSCKFPIKSYYFLNLIKFPSLIEVGQITIVHIKGVQQ